MMTNRQSFFVFVVALVMLAFGSVMGSGVWADVVSYQGVVSQSVNGSVSMTFTLYYNDGTSLWTETKTVAVVNGNFSVQLGSVTSIPTSIFTGNPVYLGIKVGADPELTPRVQLLTAPNAYQSDTVTTNSLVVLNGGGTAVVTADANGVMTSGLTVSGLTYTAGSNFLTIDTNKKLGTSTPQSFSGGTVANTTVFSQGVVAVTGNFNQTVTANQFAGPLTGTASYATTAGIATTANNISMSASSGQVLKYNGASWVPGAEATGVAYTAGTGISISGTTINVVQDVSTVAKPTFKGMYILSPTSDVSNGLLLYGNSLSNGLGIYSSLGLSAYNNLTQNNDAGLIYKRGGTSQGFVIAPWEASSQGIRISSAGNVGIGTATPATTLDVNGAIKSTGVAVNGTVTTNSLYVNSAVYAAGAMGIITATGGTTYIDWRTGNYQRIRFDSGTAGGTATITFSNPPSTVGGSITALTLIVRNTTGSTFNLQFGATGSTVVFPAGTITNVRPYVGAGVGQDIGCTLYTFIYGADLQYYVGSKIDSFQKLY